MKRVVLLACLGLFGVVHNAPAVTRTWTGAASSDFYLAANWSPNGVPAAGDILNIGTGTVSISPTFASSGEIHWTGGFLSGGLVIAAGGTLAISGPDTKSLGCNLTNAGTLTLSGPLAFNDYNRQLVNQAGALIDVQTDVAITGGWSGQQILNAGTFRKSGGVGLCSVSGDILFLNNGAIQAQQGTVQLNGGGSLAGVCSASAGAAILFNNGSFSLDPGAVFSGGGFVGVVSGGTPTLTGTLASPMTWTGGTIYGGWAIGASGLLVASGPDTKQLWCNLTNAGTLNLSGPLRFADYNRLLVNLGGALVDVQADLAVTGGWSGQQFLNAGLCRKSGGTNLLTWSTVTFVNRGSLEIQSGALVLDAALVMDSGSMHSTLLTTGNSSLAGTLVGAVNWTNGAAHGGFTVGANGTLVVSGPGTKYLECNITNAGTITLSSSLGFIDYNRQFVNQAGALFDVQADVSITGGWSGQQFLNGGTFRKSGGTNRCVIGGDIAFQNSGTLLVQSGGVDLQGGGLLSGVCTANLGTAITFSGGALGLTPQAVFGGGGFIGVAGGGPTLTGTLGTTLDWTSGTLYGGWGIATNGLLVATGPDTKSLHCNLTNDGTIRLASPLYFIDYDRQLVNQAGALIDVQTDVAITGGWSGQQILNSGIFRKSGGTNLCFIGSDIAFQNSGAIQAQSGAIQLNGGGAFSGTCSASSDAAILFHNRGFSLDSGAMFGGGGFIGVTNGGTPTFTGTLATTMSWNGGVIYGGWSIAPTGRLVASGPDTKQLWCDLTNAGTITLSSPLHFGDYNRLLVNSAGALVDVQADVDITGGWSGQQILNAGTFRKSEGTNTCVIDGSVAFGNAGTVETLDGLLAFHGAFTSTDGKLSVRLNSDSDWGRMSWSAPLMLDGAFSVGLLPNYTPSVSNVFEVLTFPSVTGAFTGYDGLDIGSGLSLTPQLDQTSFSLVVGGSFVPTAPSIHTQPFSQTVRVGSNVSFSVTVTGTPPLNIQWRFNQTEITGQTNATLALANVQLSQAGAYSVLITNLAGSISSSNAVLTVISPSGNCDPAPAGLVGWWPGDGAFADQAGANNGSPAGGVGFLPAVVGQGYHLTNGVVLIPGSFNFSAGNAFSFETWFRFDSTAGGYQGIMSVPDGSCNYRLMITSGLQLFYDAGTHTDMAVGPILERSRFYHVALVIRGGGSAQVFLNGQLISDSPAGVPATLPDAASFALGCGEAPSMYVMQDGIVDEASLYSSALSSNDVAAIYAAGSAGKCGGKPAPGAPFSDDFNEPNLKTGWTFESPNPGSGYFLPGKNLEIVAASSGGGSDLWPGSNFNAPRLLQPVDPSFDWTIETKFDFAPGYNYQGAGLLLAMANSTFSSAADCYRIAERGFSSEAGQTIYACGNSVPYSGTVSFLRVQKSGSNYTGWWSADGTNWTLDGSVNLTTRWAYVGLDVLRQAWDGTSQDAAATFYYFHALAALPPAISSQPTDQTVAVGANVALSVTASGTAPLWYQWQFNGSAVAGQTNPLLTLTNVQLTQAGNYSVVVTNLAGSILSSNALLTVNPVSPNCVPAPAGLVSSWAGEGNAADSRGVNDGVLKDGPGFALGKVGHAFSFDGVSGWIDILNSASLNPTGPFSVEAWIKARPHQLSPDGLFLIVDKSHGWTDSTGWGLQGNLNGTVAFLYGVGGAGISSFPQVQTLTSVLDDQWHHLAGVFTGTQLEIYLDGVLQNSLAQTVLPANNQRDVEIGRSWGGGAPTRYFNGLMDEVSYYNSALSSNDVTAIYAAGSAGKCPVSPVTEPGLRADYRFQNNLLSSVGNAPALTNLGEIVFAAATVDGVPRQVLDFGFNDGVLLQAGASVISSNVYSVVVLAELDDVSYYRRLLGFTTIPVDDGWYVHNGRLSYWPVTDGSSAAIAAGQFAQIVVTRAADGAVRGYVDGVPQIQFSDAAGNIGPGTNGVLRFLRDNTAEASAGKVARIRIYDVALTDAQIAALDRLPTVPRPSLIVTSAGNNVIVSWPATFSGYRLRYATSLTAPVAWTTLSTVPIAGGMYQLSLPDTNQSGFFQLVNP